jgi:hypothetical protein
LFRKLSCFKSYQWTSYLIEKAPHTHTHSISWVIYLKFLFTGRFVLIEYLTLNYIFAYFLIAIWLSYQLYIHVCSEAICRKKLFFNKFFSDFQLFSVKRLDRLGLQFGRKRTCRLLIWQWIVRTSWYYIWTRSLQVFFRRLLSQPAAHHYIFIVLSWHVLCFSREFLSRFWHSLNISSHSMIFSVFFFVLVSFCAF